MPARVPCDRLTPPRAARREGQPARLSPPGRLSAAPGSPSPAPASGRGPLAVRISPVKSSTKRTADRQDPSAPGAPGKPNAKPPPPLAEPGGAMTSAAGRSAHACSEAGPGPAAGRGTGGRIGTRRRASGRTGSCRPYAGRQVVRRAARMLRPVPGSRLRAKTRTPRQIAPTGRPSAQNRATWSRSTAEPRYCRIPGACPPASSRPSNPVTSRSAQPCVAVNSLDPARPA